MRIDLGEDRERAARSAARALRGEPGAVVRDLGKLANRASGGWPHTKEQAEGAAQRLAGELSEIGIDGRLALDPLVVARAVELWRDARREKPTFRRPISEDGKTHHLVSKGRVLALTGQRMPLPAMP